MNKELPDNCPICGNDMFLQMIEQDFDPQIKTIGSACMDCNKVWVLSNNGIKNHPNKDQIILIT